MKDLDRMSGMILFLLGLGIFLKSLSYPLGSIHSPGAGLFPLLASVTLMAFSGFMVGHSFSKKSEGEGSKTPFFSEKEAPKRVFFGFLALVSFRFLFPVIGFAPSTFFFIFFLTKFLGHYGYKVSLSFSMLTALVAYYLFQVWLMIQMPKGVFGI